jgi:hypothetical protein
MVMQAVLWPVCTSWAVSTSPTAVRHVLVPLNAALRTPFKQKTLIIARYAPNISGWHHQTRQSSSAQKAKDLNQQGIDKELSKFDDALQTEKEKQARTPWHREGTDQAPVARPRSASAMTKGRTRVFCVPVAKIRQASFSPLRRDF